VATVVFPQPPFVFITTIRNTVINRTGQLKTEKREISTSIGVPVK
jgi:hypothetical protein